jgi:hypothetical protein
LARFWSFVIAMEVIEVEELGDQAKDDEEE